MAWTYILRCRDGSYYVGSTEKDPEARLWEHNNDEILAARYTIKRRPLTLLYVEEFDRIDEAFARERQLHGWSRAKKEALMAGDLERLADLAKSRAGRATPRQARGPSGARGSGRAGDWASDDG